MALRTLALAAFAVWSVAGASVRVEKLVEKPDAPLVEKGYFYDAEVVLNIENPDGSLTPTSWSTRK